MTTLKPQGSLSYPLVTGILALILGVYLLVGGAQAGAFIGLAACLYLMIDGCLFVIPSLLSQRSFQLTRQMLRGLIGIAAALIIFILHFGLGVLDLMSGYMILALALVAYGILGLSMIKKDGESPWPWRTILVNLLLLFWGVLIFIARIKSLPLQLWSAVVLVLVGIVLVVYVWMQLQRKTVVVK